MTTWHFLILLFNLFNFNAFAQQYCWHLQAPGLNFKQTQMYRKIRIALFDTCLSDSNFSPDKMPAKFLTRKTRACDQVNISSEKVFYSDGLRQGSMLNNSPEFKNSTVFFPKNKNFIHADFLCAIINQIAPEVSISVFSVLNHDGCGRKEQLHTVLKASNIASFDIVLLAFDILDFNPVKNDCDAEILRLLNECNCVIVAAGNFGFVSKLKPFFSYFFFSVGSFERKQDEWRMCDFSGYSAFCKPSFAMPGKDILCAITKDETVLISGTSISAALFVGYVARYMMSKKEKVNILSLKKMCKRSAKIFDQSWKKKVKYGVVNFERLKK